jgi:hypothetical protein
MKDSDPCTCGLEIALAGRSPQPEQEQEKPSEVKRMAGIIAKQERIFEAVVHTYEGDDQMVPEDLREASFVKRARQYRAASRPASVSPPENAEKTEPNLRRDLTRLLDNLYGLHLRPGHIDAIMDVIHLHAPVKVPVSTKDEGDLRLALRRLMKESAAVLVLAEPQLRDAIGNTNLAVFKLRIEEAGALLEVSPKD